MKELRHIGAAGLGCVVGIQIFKVVRPRQAAAIEQCTPNCSLEGPAATLPELAAVLGGVLLASLVFVALGRAVGRRGGEV